MGLLLLQLFAFECLVLNLLSNTHVVANFFNSSVQYVSCHEEETSALLQFKHSFIIDRSASSSETAFPKVSTWKLEGQSNNCCSWDGVECDEKTGHVVSLDLGSSCLYGSINSNSSLFRLVHLWMLNLADNQFNFSLIPSAIGQFSRLAYLDLSNSRFSGQIPSEISYLSQLTSLDLSSTYNDPSQEWLLELKHPNLRSLIRNLTSLETLSLDAVYIPSTVPYFLANFSSLKSLYLGNCGLYGEFPAQIFQLRNLQNLDLRWNMNLTGYLPEFHQRSPLEWLVLWDFSFSGGIPSSIDKLHLLRMFSLGGCKFSGPLPSSLGKLTQLIRLNLGGNRFYGIFPPFLQNLTKLKELLLPGNQLTGPIPSWLGNLTEITHLLLSDNSLCGPIPSSFQNLTQLITISFHRNKLIGPIPSWLGNFTQLTYLSLHNNQLNGPFPHSLSKLTNLVTLSLANNNLSGTVKFGTFFYMKHLADLNLCENGFSLLFGQIHANATLPMFKALRLCDCNLSEFPNFIKYQSQLELLELDGNKIHGQVPTWISNTSTETLITMNLSNNFVTGFPDPSKILPWRRLRIMDLSSNLLQGPLPIPPPSTKHYDVSSNKLSGEISSFICNLSSLWMLDLSNNSFSGKIPPCLGNFGDSLKVLNLLNNFFRGVIPSLACTPSTNLRVLDISMNQLEGRLPRSLATCTTLESLDLQKNKLSDVFPSWLGTLPELKHLILGKNRFYGAIGKPKKSFEFPKLCVVDLSSNNFTGQLPSEYLSSWSAMTAVTVNSTYLVAKQILYLGDYNSLLSDYPFSFTIMNKGLEIKYEKIQSSFSAIDLSSNIFTGEIPEIIGNLKGLHSLNLSNNKLIDFVPPSLANISMLESLDLSHNRLSGVIPQQLVQLNFLQKFDVSHNSLTGPIPQGKQFNTFENSSYEGNQGLCGKPLSKECESSKALPPQSSIVPDDNDSGSAIEFDWKFVLAGFVSGIVIGFSLGDIVITRRWGCLVKILRRMPVSKRREWRQHRNN